MTSTNAASSYAAEVMTDPELNTTAIALSYTDLHDPTRNVLACIAPGLGSNWYRLRVGEHELMYFEPEEVKGRGHTGNFVLWPFPNRVRNQRYTYRGREYTFASVKRVTGPLVHGLVFDQPWSYSQPVVRPDGVSVTTSIEITPDHPYYEAYPFPSRLSLTYTLSSAGVTVTYTVQNKGTQTLPYGFALHPYFHMPSGAERTMVTLPASYVMEADHELLPTGRVHNVHSVMYGMFDLNQPTPVSHLKLDHVYIGLPAEQEARVDYPDLNLRLRIVASDEFTHAVIFTLTPHPFFCLENQTCSTDAINLAQRGMQDIAHLLELEPGAERSGSIRYLLEEE